MYPPSSRKRGSIVLVSSTPEVDTANASFDSDDTRYADSPPPLTTTKSGRTTRPEHWQLRIPPKDDDDYGNSNDDEDEQGPLLSPRHLLEKEKERRRKRSSGSRERSSSLDSRRSAGSNHHHRHTAGGRPWLRAFKITVALAAVFALGMGVGWETTSRDKHHETLLVQEAGATTCNPYDQHGILHVNQTVWGENKWEPIGAPEACDSTEDWLGMLYKAQMRNEFDQRAEFARNRTVVMMGDSVDRGHIVDFCEFVHGSLQGVGLEHELSIPYPPGKERPTAEQMSKYTTGGEWPDFEQSRPKVCYLGRYNLAVIFVFYYGFRPLDNFIITKQHYYPPALAEDRFDQILLPLISKVSQRYGSPSIPTLLSISPTFWGLLRLSQEDDLARQELVDSGVSWDDAVKVWEPFRTMSSKRVEVLERRMREFLKYVAKAWRVEGVEGAQKRPRILWRALHHVKEHHEVPYTGVQAVDQVGRAVVDSLKREGQAAEGGHSTWGRWARTWSGYATLVGEDVSETEARRAGLGQRLRVDEWGSLMLGMEKYFRDDLHPKQLPGGYLWGNMMLHQLKMAVDDEALEA
ncbi:hypothetical protein T439DRAFT_328814 [Meredithblackwellia eburnea MCA 4105]